MGSFLLGNGCDKVDIYACLAPRFGNVANHTHMRSWLAHLERCPRTRSYYFDLDKQDYHRHDGTVALLDQNGKVLSPPQPLVRVHNAWEVEQRRIRRQERRYATLAEQQRFFSPA